VGTGVSVGVDVGGATGEAISRVAVGGADREQPIVRASIKGMRRRVV
jgi:hypothetical protein